MTSPLERAARALCENPSEDPDELIMMMNGEMWPRWRAEVWRVKSVLTAIRDFPNFNDPVTKAGSAVLSVGASPHWSKDHEAQKVWKAMIDAALSEG